MHAARPFFKDLVKYMTSGPVLLQVLEGENAIAKNREIMGATDPKKAAPGTIRADLAESIEANTVHGSDAPETAADRNRVLLPRRRRSARAGDLMCRAIANERVNLLGLSKAELEAFVGELGSKPFRARQLMNWLYKRGESDIAAMTDLAKDFRAQLVAARGGQTTRDREDARCASDGTRKWLLSGGNGQAFEMVFIPEEDRGTLCISSQVGCVLDCSFCSTAQQGFNRNLTTAEIVGQVWLANKELGWKVGDDRIITNIVLMGMGEPLANFRNVMPAIRIFLDDLGFDISRRRVTLSHLRPGAADLQAGRGSELRAGRVAARAQRRAAQPAGADQPQAQHRRAARGLLALPRRTERPQRHVRIRDARRHQRLSPNMRASWRGCCGASPPSST